MINKLYILYIYDLRHVDIISYHISINSKCPYLRKSMGVILEVYVGNKCRLSERDYLCAEGKRGVGKATRWSEQ